VKQAFPCWGRRVWRGIQLLKEMRLLLIQSRAGAVAGSGFVLLIDCFYYNDRFIQSEVAGQIKAAAAVAGAKWCAENVPHHADNEWSSVCILTG
jgi:hypothetical protein